jgi:hypothetical protein
MLHHPPVDLATTSGHDSTSGDGGGSTFFIFKN